MYIYLEGDILHMDKDIQIIIGLMGSKGSGKDTLADEHIAKYDASGKIILSQYLKDLCARVFKLPSDFFFTAKKDDDFARPIALEKKHIREIIRDVREVLPESVVPYDKFDPDRIGIQRYFDQKFKSPREMLQYIGTDMIQSFCKEFHAHITFNKYTNKKGIWFITDLRFKHEYDLAYDKFPLFYPILITKKDKAVDNHISEQEYKSLKPFLTISNDSTIESFIDKSLKAFEKIKEDALKRYDDVKDRFDFTEKPEVVDMFDNDDGVVKNGNFIFSTPERTFTDFDKFD